MRGLASTDVSRIRTSAFQRSPARIAFTSVRWRPGRKKAIP